MLKIYITPNRVDFTVGINVGKTRQHINFAPRQTAGIRTGTFSTSDEEVQEALESHPNFGTKWVLVKEKVVKEVAPEVTVTGLVVVPKSIVSHFQTAKKYLIDKGLATAEDVRTKEQVLAVAESNKIVFAGWLKDAN
jgi:hypothetical protein